MAYRVLLVDDYEPWRRLIAVKLQKSLQWQVVAEASDGLDAVRKAETFRPDLILLDIGLPMLGGIDAARQILAHDPDIRILFLTENFSSEIIEAAFETGGRGYLLKSDAAQELMPAMSAVIEGRRFVSRSLAGQTFDREAQRSVRKSALHEVAFYSDNGALLNDYGRFAASALNTGKVLIVASGLILRPALDQELTSRGIDVARITREGRFRWFDVSDVLSSFVVENRLDERRFWEVVPPLIMEAARASTADPPRVAAWGEAAPTLWQTGHVEAAIRLEQLWDELVRICDVDVFCPYPAKGAEDSSAYERLCAAHSVVHA